MEIPRVGTRPVMSSKVAKVCKFIVNSGTASIILLTVGSLL